MGANVVDLMIDDLMIEVVVMTEEGLMTEDLVDFYPHLIEPVVRGV